MDGSYPLGKAGHVNVRVGRLIVGVRANDGEMMQLLRVAIAPSVVDHNSEHANVSLFFGERKGHAKALHIVKRRSNRIFSSTDRGEVLRSAIDQLNSFLPVASGLMRLDARTMRSENGAVLVCSSFERAVKQSTRADPGGRWRTEQSMYSVVDPTTFEVVLQPVSLELDDAGIAAIDAQYPTFEVTSGAGEPEQRLPIGAIVIHRSDSYHLQLAGRAAELMAFSQVSAPRGEWIDGDYLEGLARLRGGVPVIVLPSLSRAGLAALLADMPAMPVTAP